MLVYNKNRQVYKMYLMMVLRPFEAEAPLNNI
jgi:hypothetical protein